LGPLSTRVPGLPIRDCAGSCNSSVHRCTRVSAIKVIAKKFFERLYLVPGLSPFEPRVKCPCAPTPPPFPQQLCLDFCGIFFPARPLNFLVITIHQIFWPSPGTLLSTRSVTSLLIDGFHFTDLQISRCYFVPNPCHLVSQV